MKVVVKLLVLFVCVSCSSLRYEKQYKNDYLQEFKMAYFKNCLKYGFKNNEIKILNSLDGSVMTEPILGTNVYKSIDSLVLKKNRERIDLSVSSSTSKAEGSAEPVYFNCLCDYNSKWLLLEAKKFYKQQESN